MFKRKQESESIFLQIVCMNHCHIYFFIPQYLFQTLQHIYVSNLDVSSPL